MQRAGKCKTSVEGHKIGRQVVKDESAEVRREVRGVREKKKGRHLSRLTASSRQLVQATVAILRHVN